MKQYQTDLLERTFLFARRVVQLFVALPKSSLAQTLGKQLLRSGTSVGANYNEAHRSRSKAEFSSIVGICLREIQETQFWVRLIAAEEIIPAKRLEALLQETDELIAIFVTIIKKSKSTVPQQ